MSDWGKYRDEAWKACSMFVRTRDCLITSNRPDFGSCVTCGSKHWIQDLDAGHFLGGRDMGILFDLRGIHSQCHRCNRMLGGNSEAYKRFMLANYGEAIINDLKRLKLAIRKYTKVDFQMLTEDWRAKTKLLTENPAIYLPTVSDHHGGYTI